MATKREREKIESERMDQKSQLKRIRQDEEQEGVEESKLETRNCAHDLRDPNNMIFKFTPEYDGQNYKAEPGCHLTTRNDNTCCELRFGSLADVEFFEGACTMIRNRPYQTVNGSVGRYLAEIDQFMQSHPMSFRMANNSFITREYERVSTLVNMCHLARAMGWTERQHSERHSNGTKIDMRNESMYRNDPTRSQALVQFANYFQSHPQTTILLSDFEYFAQFSLNLDIELILELDTESPSRQFIRFLDRMTDIFTPNRTNKRSYIWFRYDWRQDRYTPDEIVINTLIMTIRKYLSAPTCMQFHIDNLFFTSGSFFDMANAIAAVERQSNLGIRLATSNHAHGYLATLKKRDCIVKFAYHTESLNFSLQTFE